MEDINLEEYKSAWKAEHSFFEEKLSRDQIVKFMQLASKNISGLFKKSLIIDILLKVVLAISIGVLLVLYSNQISVLIINTTLIIFTLTGILLQIRTFKKIPEVHNNNENVKTLLYSYIDFYKRRFTLSLIITSLSGSLVFIVGAFYYMYYKYGKIHSFHFDDYLVFGVIIVISFLFSLLFYSRNFNFHVHQLENSLADIEQDSMSESKLKHHKKLYNRNIIIYSIILSIGLMLLVFILFIK